MIVQKITKSCAVKPTLGAIYTKNHNFIVKSAITHAKFIYLHTQTMI